MTEQRRRRGPRGDIRAEDLLTAAEGVLRSGGPEGLSLRSVAREAGVTPTVLYTYFDDMADLRNRLGDDFLGRLDLALLRSHPPGAALRRFLYHLLAVFHDSPGHVALLASQRVAGPHSLALNEALLGFFVEAVGHTPERAAALTLFATEWVHGRLLLWPSAPVTEDFKRAMSRIDPAEFPRTTASLSAPVEDEGVELLVRTAVPAGPDGG